MKFISKETNKRLCLGLTSREMACQCENDFCRATIIHPDLIKAYEKFRKAIKTRLIINSGYRCPAHNKNTRVQGSNLSRHQAGMAIDISTKTIDHIPEKDLEKLAKDSGFTYIKFYTSWIHLDVR